MAKSPQEKPKRREKTPEIRKYEKDRRKRLKEEFSRLLEIPLTEQTEEEKRKLAKMMDQRKRRNEQERQRYSYLPDEKKNERHKQRTLAYRRKAEEKRIPKKIRIEPRPKRRKTLTDEQRKRYAEGGRRRRLEDEKILNSELAQVSDGQIQRALLVMQRKKIKNERDRQRYQNLSEEEKREINKLKGDQKRRKEEEISEEDRDGLIRVQKDRRNAVDRARRRRVREEKERASGSLVDEVEMDAGIGRATGVCSLETPVEFRRSRRLKDSSMETLVVDVQTDGLRQDRYEESTESRHHDPLVETMDPRERSFRCPSIESSLEDAQTDGAPERKKKKSESHRQRYHKLVKQDSSDSDANDNGAEDSADDGFDLTDSDTDDDDVDDSDDDEIDYLPT